MSDLVASLILKLEDGISGGLRAIEDVLESITGITDRLSLDRLTGGASAVGALNGQLSQTTGLLERIGNLAKTAGDGFVALGRAGGGAMLEFGKRVQGRIHEFQEASSNLVNRGMGAAAEGFVVYEPMKKYAEYENIVRHIGITEGLSGAALDARIAKLQEFFRADALHTGQSSESVAQAYQDLTQMGIHENLDTIIQAHSRAATAYNTTAEALGPAVGALIQTMKVPAGELAATMSAMAQASKEGRFKIEDFSREMPGVAAQMALLGMTGRRAADTTFAALEIVMRGSSQPGQAAVNLSDLLRYIRGPVAAKHFASRGINLHNVLEQGIHQGDVLGAVLDAVRDKVKGKDIAGFSTEFGKLFHNQQAGDGLLILTQQRAEFEKMRAALDKIDSGVVDRDFISAFKAPSVQLRIMGELMEQITERLGQGFLPVLQAINFTLSYMNDGLKWASDHYPRFTGYVLAAVAGLLAIGSALAIIGAVIPVVSAGFGLVTTVLGFLLSPVKALFIALRFLLFLVASTASVSVGVVGAFAAIAAAIGLAAYDIYAHWAGFRGFFAEMWDGVKQLFWGFLDFLSGAFIGDIESELTGLKSIGAGIEKIFGGLWSTVKLIFTDFVHWVDGWTGGLGTRAIDGITRSWSFVTGGVRGLFGHLQSEFVIFVHWVEGWAGGLGTRAIDCITRSWGAVTGGVRGLFARLQSEFDIFVQWVEGWAASIGTHIIDGLTRGWSAVTGGIHGLMGKLEGEFDNSKLGRLLGLAETKTAVPTASNDNGSKVTVQSAAVNGSVDIRVHADQGTAVTAAQSSGAVNVQAPITAPARGATVGRP